MTNPVCLVCRAGANRINGRWCTILDRLVEYSSLPPCDNRPNDNNN